MPVEIYPTCLFKPMNIAAFMRWVSSDWPNSCACSSHYYRLVSAHVQSVLELVAQATSLQMKRRGCKDMPCCSSLQDNSKNFKLAENRRGIFFSDFWLILLIWRSEGSKSNRVAPQELVEIQYPCHELTACHDLVSRVTVWITGAWTQASLCTLLQRYMSGSWNFNAYNFIWLRIQKKQCKW